MYFIKRRDLFSLICYNSHMNTIKTIIVVIVLILLGYIATLFVKTEEPIDIAENGDDEGEIIVTNFRECVAAGNPVMESYPRQCIHEGENFTEYIGNELEKADLITISNPRPNQIITSPITVRGEARGNWFFEATFPVVLTDWDGLIIAEGIATAEGEWMTEEFVPYSVELTFETPTLYDRGTLILQKSNASGLPEHDDALEIPILFSL